MAVKLRDIETKAKNEAEKKAKHIGIACDTKVRGGSCCGVYGVRSKSPQR